VVHRIKAVRGAQRVAGLGEQGVHILRHTFCSHLAMRGAPARAIQELAGHADLSTTQRYMHLSPAALDAAIRLLDGAAENRGGIMEAQGTRGLSPPLLLKKMVACQLKLSWRHGTAHLRAPRYGGQPSRVA